MNKAMKSWKLYMQFLGNKMYDKKMKEKICVQVDKELLDK